jgi:hypothetical protein
VLDARGKKSRSCVRKTGKVRSCVGRAETEVGSVLGADGKNQALMLGAKRRKIKLLCWARETENQALVLGAQKQGKIKLLCWAGRVGKVKNLCRGAEAGEKSRSCVEAQGEKKLSSCARRVKRGENQDLLAGAQKRGKILYRGA